MTIWDLFAACWRRWLVLLVGLVVTAAFSGLIVARAPGVYFSQVDVVFLASQTARNPNALASPSETLIMAAGIVLNKVIEGEKIPATSSTDVTMVDQGILRGSMIRLPNAGGQWANNFNKPVLDVQAAGDSPEIVLAELDSAIERIRDVLYEQQKALGVLDINMIQTQLSPEVPQVHYLKGPRLRAAAVSIVLGIGLTLAVVVLVDNRWPKGERRHRRHRAAVS